MTFLEAAIELLRQTGGPLTVKELTERSIQQGLLTHEGRTPELSMQARLAQELRKGAHTLLVKLNTSTYGLRRYDKPRLGDAPPAGETPAEPAAEPELAAGVSAPVSTEIVEEVEAEGEAEAESEGEGEGDKKKRRRRGGRGRKKKDAEPVAAEPVAEVVAPVVVAPAVEPEAGTPEEALAAEQLADEADEEAAAEAARHVAASAERLEAARARASSAPITLPPAFAPADGPPVDLDGFLAPPRTRRLPVGAEASLSEEDLAAQYGDELGGSVVAPVEGEVVDEQTADEDRPMLGEITADRGRNNRRDRHRRGKERERTTPSGRERGGERKEDRAAARPTIPRPESKQTPRAEVRPAPRAEVRDARPVPTPVPATAPLPVDSGELAARPAASLAEAGVQLLRSINDGRPASVKQLATLAGKRRLLVGDPEETWKPLRAALADDSRQRGKKGLRVRVKAQGADQFALAAGKLEPELLVLEEQLAGTADKLGRETRLAFRRRLAKLPLPALETVARLLLERLGFTDIERVKRLEPISYFSAKGKQGALPVRALISVRAGGSEADRRAVGELRAGVVAKQLDVAILLNTGRIGTEAEREARQPGAPITVYDGDAFADALCHAGIGTQSALVPVVYLDPDFFAELE